MKHLIFLFLIFITFPACKESSEASTRNDVPGEYFELEKDDIKIFLPAYFRAFSAKDYEQLIDALPPSEEKRIERQRFNFLKHSKGTVYYFKDIGSSTLISIKMGKYLPFTKRESSQLLGLLSNSCSHYAEMLNMNCEKLTAGYSGNKRTKVFKAAYKITDGNGYNNYNIVYFISSNYKTFAMNIFSNTNQNYNPFIEKIVVR